MRFFTTEWISGRISARAAAAVAKAYARHLAEMGHKVPYPLRALLLGVNLHDFLIEDTAKAAEGFILRGIGGDNETGYYRATIRYLNVLSLTDAPRVGSSRAIEILYDEYDFADASGTAVTHRLLSREKKEYAIVFRNAALTLVPGDSESFLALRRRRQQM